MAKEWVCTSCGYKGKQKQQVKGSCLIELVLWLTFIVPGIIYTLWRLTSGKVQVCPKCGAQGMIPADSPMAQKILS